MAVYFGFNPPFVGGSQAVMSRQEDVRLIKNDIIQLLLTSPGERVHRPDFGTPIRESLFEPSDEISYELLADDIQRQLVAREPRVIEPRVYIVPDSSRHLITLKVIAQLTFDPTVTLELEQEILIPGGV